MDAWWAYVALGVVAGVLGAALGVGGGIVMVPVLVMAFSYTQKMAQGASLTVMVLMTLVAAARYWAEPSMRPEWHAVVLMGVAAMIGAVAGSELARVLPTGILQKAFAVVMVVAAIRLAFFTPSPAPKGEGHVTGTTLDMGTGGGRP